MVHRGWLRADVARGAFDAATGYRLALGRTARVITWRSKRNPRIWIGIVESEPLKVIALFEGLRTRDSVARAATAFWKEWR